MHIQIQQLQLQDFRCHAQANWNFNPGVTVVHGANGCGKTSILEAIALMAQGRSFRQGRDPSLVRWSAQQCKIDGIWRRYGPLRIHLQGRRNQLQASMQGQKVTLRKELTELLPIVIDAPQGKPLIDGVTADRRRWLDALVKDCEHHTHEHQRAYLRALMQRSRLLRQTLSSDELVTREHQMVVHGKQWCNARDRICHRINALLSEEDQLTSAPIRLQLHTTANNEHELWIKQLLGSRQDDRRLGRCRIGPHADRLNILRGEHEIRRVGSRGQHRTAAIAMRLAECHLRQESRGVWPLLLLDDGLEALDAQHQRRILARLLDYPGQTLMSTPADVESWKIEGVSPIAM